MIFISRYGTVILIPDAEDEEGNMTGVGLQSRESESFIGYRCGTWYRPVCTEINELLTKRK
jgi:hypothetical protein